MDNKNIDLKQKFMAVCVVVKNGDKTLILRRKDWVIEKPQFSDICFPGGKQDKGESADSAAVRELCEETGVKAQIKDITLLGSRYYEEARGTILFFGVEFNKCSGDAEVQELEKHSEVAFLPIDEVIKEVGFDRISKPVLEYLCR